MKSTFSLLLALFFLFGRQGDVNLETEYGNPNLDIETAT